MTQGRVEYSVTDRLSVATIVVVVVSSVLAADGKGECILGLWRE